MDDSFITGLVVGRNEAAAQSQEWAEYARGIQAQAGQLHQELHAERYYRSENRADIAGLRAAIAAMPESARQEFAVALANHYLPAFRQRAAELGLPADYAENSARLHLNLQMSNSRAGSR
ncbi:MAG: hypothetical protein FD176_2237 [Rhodospirillaceae bacterium]|nr:MAG: hypothetical protein FD176_2237 [Rhodospirillaceae bacterium]TNC95810.1 MAG: hypothetical protein FD119_2185 [Stygiobacter sp.]